jgi:hypothetical protein
MRGYGYEYEYGRGPEIGGRGGRGGYDRTASGGDHHGYGREFQSPPEWRTQSPARDARAARVWNRPDDRQGRPRGAYDFGYDVTRGYSAFSSRGPYGGYFGAWDLRPMMAGYGRDLRHMRRRR